MKICKLMTSFLLMLCMFVFTSCVWKQAGTQVAIKRKAFQAQVSSVSLVNHQFIFTGQNLDQVETVKLKDGATENLFEIVSKSASQIVVNSISSGSIAAGKVLDFILADAYSAVVYQVNFSLCNSTLNGKGFDCNLTANDRDVLSYDAGTGKWIPRNLNGLNYIGVFTFTLPTEPEPAAANPGDYLVISGAGNINITPVATGVPAPVAFSSGDWIAWSGEEWQKISNSRTVLSFNTRTGNILPKNDDYSMSQLSDYDRNAVKASGNILSWSGTKWTPVSTLPTTTSVTTDSIGADAITSAKIADGTIADADVSATAAIAVTKIGQIGAMAAPAGTNVLNTDTINSAFAKLQNVPTDYISKSLLTDQTVAGTLLIPTAPQVASPILAAANVSYVGAPWSGGTANAADAVRETGKVGIGIAVPGYPLDVRSTTAAQTVANFENTNAGVVVAFFKSGGQACSVEPGGAGFACLSDRRLKENIQEIPDALSKVLSLRGVTYQWKDRSSNDNRRSVGFIAQEVEKVAPELVGETSNGYKQVGYANFVAVVTQAVRELYTKYVSPLWENDKKQDERIKKLEAENKELRERLDRIEQELTQKK